MQITLKIEVQDDVLETLNFLASALAHANGMKNTVKALEEIKPKTEEIEEVEKEEVVIEKEVDTKSEFTREQVREAFLSKNKPSQREQLKAILTKYNTKNISGLEEQYFAEAMKDLDAI